MESRNTQVAIGSQHQRERGQAEVPTTETVSQKQAVRAGGEEQGWSVKMIYWCNYTLNTDNPEASVPTSGVPRAADLEAASPEDSGTPHTSTHNLSRRDEMYSSYHGTEKRV
jgi:hypothetical protein